MSDDEILRDCQKFYAYMEANGFEVRGHAFWIGDQVFFKGDPKVITVMALTVAADSLGFKLVDKP